MASSVRLGFYWNRRPEITREDLLRVPRGSVTLEGVQIDVAVGLRYLAAWLGGKGCISIDGLMEDAATSAIHRAHPGKLLAYNCSPSFNWEKNLSRRRIAGFRDELASLGYQFQFITLAGFHALNHSMFKLAKEFATQGMPAFVRLQKAEFQDEREGYRAVKHQAFVGTNYFDDVSSVISSNSTSTLAMKGSTEEEQFERKP